MQIFPNFFRGRSISNEFNEDLVFVRITDSTAGYDGEEVDKVIPIGMYADYAAKMSDVTRRVSKFGQWLGIVGKGDENDEE